MQNAEVMLTVHWALKRTDQRLYPRLADAFIQVAFLIWNSMIILDYEEVKLSCNRSCRLYVFGTIGSHMEVRLSALQLGRPLPRERFLLVFSIRSWVNQRAKIWLEGLRQLKNKTTSSGMEPQTFSIVAQCPEQQIHLSVYLSNFSRRYGGAQIHFPYYYIRV